MKLSKRQLRSLIESVINEKSVDVSVPLPDDDSVTFGLLTGGGTAAFLGTLATGIGGKTALFQAMNGLAGVTGTEFLTGATTTTLQNVISGMGVSGDALATQGILGGAAFSAAAVGLAGFAGYKLGSYINDVMSGNTGDEEEKFINSFKKNAKMAIGKYGTKILGFELDWDTTDDDEYKEAAAKKGYKGLSPRHIDRDRLKKLTSMIIINRNYSEDGKLPKALDRLFAYGYLNPKSFKEHVIKKEKEMKDAFIKKLEDKLEKTKKRSKIPKEAINESRGSLYRKRYRRY